MQRIFEEVDSLQKIEESTVKSLNAAVFDLQRWIQKIIGKMQSMHSQRIKNFEGVSELGKKIKEMEFVENIRKDLERINSLIPPNEFAKFKRRLPGNIWRTLTFIVCTIQFMCDCSIPLKFETEEFWGLDKFSSIELSIEDYLLGVIDVFKEVIRLSVNCVIRQDFYTPFRAKKYLENINGALKLFNFKNSILRRRFDSCKYDIRKINDIVNDISTKGLLSEEKIAEFEKTTEVKLISKKAQEWINNTGNDIQKQNEEEIKELASFSNKQQEPKDDKMIENNSLIFNNLTEDEQGEFNDLGIFIPSNPSKKKNKSWNNRDSRQGRYTRGGRGRNNFKFRGRSSGNQRRGNFRNQKRNSFNNSHPKNINDNRLPMAFGESKNKKSNDNQLPIPFGNTSKSNWNF